jgi:hypothetical protein
MQFVELVVLAVAIAPELLVRAPYALLVSGGVPVPFAPLVVFRSVNRFAGSVAVLSPCARTAPRAVVVSISEAGVIIPELLVVGRVRLTCICGQGAAAVPFALRAPVGPVAPVVDCCAPTAAATVAVSASDASDTLAARDRVSISAVSDVDMTFLRNRALEVITPRASERVGRAVAGVASVRVMPRSCSRPARRISSRVGVVARNARALTRLSTDPFAIQPNELRGTARLSHLVCDRPLRVRLV